MFPELLYNKRTWLYGTTNMNTLPRTLTQEGTEIPDSVVNNDVGTVLEWTAQCLAVLQPQDGVDLTKAAKPNSDIQKAATDFRKYSDTLKVADLNEEEFKGKLIEICHSSVSGSVTSKGNIGMTRPVAELLDSSVITPEEHNAGVMMQSITANAFNRTSVGARIFGSSRHQNDQSATSGRTATQRFLSSTISNRLARDQQERATQQRSALPEDSQSSMGFYTHRAKLSIPVHVTCWVELCQKEFVTALAKGHLNFGVLIYVAHILIFIGIWSLWMHFLVLPEVVE